MLERIITFSVRQKFVALSLVVLVAFGGIAALRQLPINSLPDVTPVQVTIITKAGRYSPFDVERLVSFPLETAMNGLPGVKEVRSVSQFGLSAVTVEFDEDTDIYFDRQMVSQRIQSVTEDLPDGVSAPQLGPISTALGEIYQYVVAGPGYSLTELRDVQDWLIAPQLKTVRGVTEINSFGGFVRQYEVIVRPAQLRSYGIGLEEVMDAIQQNNSVSGGNYLQHNREQYIIRGFGLIRDESDIGNVVVSKLGGRPIFIRDIAIVREGEQLRQGAVTKDGKGEVVTGIVMMLRGGNGREVIQDIEARIAEITPGLPDGITIEKFYDQSDLVARTTSTITTNLLEGGFFVIAILLLMLGEIAGALVVASVIPLSMLFAFIGMREFGLAANLMSLGAIDFGMVVDGSVVMIENMVHRLQTKEKDRSIDSIIIESGTEVARPIFFGVLIILMVYVPIATFSGMEGILFRPMAITVAAAVFGSLILALVYVPAIAAIVFRKGVKVRKNYIMAFLQPRFSTFLERNLEKRTQTVLIAAAIFVPSLILIPFLGTEFLPELDEGSILVEQIRMPSSTLDESVENANWFAGKLLENIPEIETVVPKTGRSDLANDWMGVHQTDVWVLLKPRETWREGMTKEKIAEAIQPFLETEPGLSYNFTQPIAMRVDELTSGVKSDVAVKLFGEDLDELQSVADEIAAMLPDLAGTDNFFVEQTVGQPYLNIDIDRAAVASFGLNVDDVQRIIEAGIGGAVVSEVFEGQRRYDIVVRFPENIRSNFDDILNIPVNLPSGDIIPLSRLATIVAEEGPREIARENGWRRVVVGINLAGIDIGTYVASLQDAIDTRIDVPAGNFITYGGAFEDQQRAMNHLLVVVPLALFIILGLLYLMFGQMRYVWLIFLNLPFALSGGIYLLWIRGLYLSVSASIGFVALFGVAVLNGVVLIAHLNTLRDKGMSLKEATITGSVDRLRPVLMTALVASLGFIPMAFNVGPGSEVQRPLATVVIGGLITATLLTLRVLPVAYYWLEARRFKTHEVTEMKSFLVTLSVIGVCFVTPAIGQITQQQVTQLGVRGAIQLAEEQNPELARARVEIDAVRADKWSAIGLRGLDLVHMREGIPNSGSGFSEQNWHITTAFPFPLAAWADLKRVNYQADSKEALLESQRWSLRSSVKKTYVQLMFAQEMVHLRTQEVDLATNLIEVVKSRVEVGESARLDLMKVELQFAAASNALTDANLAFENARYELFRTVGIDPDNQRYDVAFPDTLTFEVVSIDQEEVMASLSRHPEAEGAAFASQSAASAVRASRMSYLPELKVGYWPQDFGSGYNSHGLEVGFRFALPFIGSSRTDREKARIQLRNTEIQSVQVSLNLKKEAESAWHGFETAKGKVVQFFQKNGSLAQELLQLTREGYQLGQLDLLTVLDTQRTYLSVQAEYYQSLKDYYVSVIDMERLLGRELVFTN